MTIRQEDLSDGCRIILLYLNSYEEIIIRRPLGGFANKKQVIRKILKDVSEIHEVNVL
jgi:hypothetical protein